jgi:agmatinase
MHEHRPLAAVVAELERGLPPAPDAGFLGARLDPGEARLVLLPVPWEATASYGGGTAAAPRAIVAASHQLDLEDGGFGRPYRAGIAFLPEDPAIGDLNRGARAQVRAAIAAAERGGGAAEAVAAVNRASAELNARVHRAACEQLDAGRHVGVVGGDHSSPWGLLQALAEREAEGFGILHVDAHHDLRRAYQGFVWSHASIFFNVMHRLGGVDPLVQVGVRDYAREESRYRQALGPRAVAFYGRDLFRLRAAGRSFASVVRQVLEPLPPRVYVSFDIDGLDPPYCPHTGTPVPGGLSYDEACYLLEELAGSGRRVIGFDLCEVAPDPAGGEWDANVGARVLYKLCGCLLRSQGLC